MRRRSTSALSTAFRSSQLAEDIGVTRKEAKAYIDRYLENYAGVRAYMKDIVAKAKQDGFVTTLFGRRRNLPELKSSNFNIRSFGERVALNTPIQGTAADIIKLAMLHVDRALRRAEAASPACSAGPRRADRRVPRRRTRAGHTASDRTDAAGGKALPCRCLPRQRAAQAGMRRSDGYKNCTHDAGRMHRQVAALEAACFSRPLVCADPVK